MFRKTLINMVLFFSLLALSFPSIPRGVSAATGSVFTSQLGFTPADIKLAVLAVPAGTVLADRTFSIFPAAGGSAVYSGNIALPKVGWIGNNSNGDTYLLDFTVDPAFWSQNPGRYFVRSNSFQSFPFDVGANVYDVRRVKPLEFFRIQQSIQQPGDSVTWRSLDGIVGGHGPGHRDDARQATRGDAGGGDRRLVQQEFIQLPGEHKNVGGGWFDAGDYNEYMGNTPWAAYLLTLTYEQFSSYWDAVDSNGNGRSDLLDYTQTALDWMLKLRHSDASGFDGSVYERVFNGYSAAFDGHPDLETDNVNNSDDRPLDTDRYADITVKSSYAMATAYRVFREQAYLDMAVKAWDWAFNNQGTVKPKVYGGGLYFGDVEIGLTLGALEIYRAQKADGISPDPKYFSYASTHTQSHLSDWINPSTWDYQQSYVLIRYYELISDFPELVSPFDKSLIVQSLEGRWDAGYQFQQNNSYLMNDEWLYGDFGQNDLSTSSAADALWVYRHSTRPDKRKYYDYAVNQMAWVFGRNPFGESWLASNLVSEYIRIPHWRTTAKHAIEGVVVPGATDRNGNRIPDYSDTGDWYYSEPTINQQAMFVRAMTTLNQVSGGPSGPADMPPTVSNVGPADGAVVAGAIAVEARVSDDRGITGVDYQIDGALPVSMNQVPGTNVWRALLNTTELSEGAHSITVLALDSAVPAQRARLSATVVVNNSEKPVLHVGDIALSLVYKGPKIQGKSVTRIVDGSGGAVSGATVTGHWEAAATDTYSGNTDSGGNATDYSNAATYNSGKTFIWVVDRVEKAGWVYDKTANVQTSVSVVAPPR